MKFLIKIFCLLSLLSSFAFSKDVWVMTDDVLDGLKPMDNCEFFLGRKFLKCTIPETGTYRVFIVNFAYDYLYFSPTKSSGYYYNTMYYYFIDKVQYSGYFAYISKYSYYKYAESDASNGQLFTYTNITEFRINNSFVECSASDNYGYKTNKCFPACPAGQSWDYENEVCYSDCSDKNLNKFGYSNGTAQGGCVDCSNALSDDQIMRCACSGFGSSYEPGVISEYPSDPSFKLGSCKSGDQIRFKSRLNDKDKDKDKKKDNNSTNLGDNNKDKDNPKPDKDKDKRNDNNSTNSSDKDNPKPDKKDNNENSNNSSGESGNSSNNNSGGSAGNGSSGGGGTGVETKPNPNNGNGKEDGKSDGKQDGKGEEGKGDDNIRPANLDYEGLKASVETFEGQFKTAIDDSFSFVNDVKASLTDTIQKIKDGNLMSLKKGAVPTTCPLSFQIDMTYFSKNLTFDFCKIVSPVSSSLYILFYLGFFILFLVVTIKLFILTFMGW